MRAPAFACLAACVFALCAGASAAQSPPEAAIPAGIQRAAKARAEGRLDEMRREVETAARLAGDVVAHRRLLAAALADNGFSELAVQVCTQTIALAPGDAALHGILGISLGRLHKYPDAIAALKIAVERDPARKDWWVELGRVHLKAGQEAAALSAIERALALAPADVAVLELRAECEYRNMRMAECESTCKTLLARDPRNLMAWQLLIRARRTQGRLDDAKKTADEAIASVGRQPDVVLERGMVLLAAGRTEESIADLKEAALGMPSDPRPMLHLCKAYTRLGMTKEAEAARARYVELSPDLKTPASRKTN